MTSPPPSQTGHRLPRRDRIAIISGLLGVAALAWIYLIVMAMGMDMPTAEAAGRAALKLHAWKAFDFWLMFLMWAVMMLGMMLPTAIPMTLIHAAVGRKAAGQGTPVAPTAAFVSGYVVIWTVFSVGATAAQFALDQAALLSPRLVSTSPALGAALLVAAGLYQFTPLKTACLDHCRSPVHFISEHWRPGSVGAFRMGIEHGAYCLGCCWVLMGLLFFGGVMNLLWIAAITGFVLFEKLLPQGRLASRVAGVALIALGATVFGSGWVT